MKRSVAESVIIILTSLMTMSCSPAAPYKSSEPERIEPKAKWEEIKSDTVSFVRMHPGAAQKNVYASWKHFSKDGSDEKEWRSGKELMSDAGLSALDALYAAVGRDLIPSDRFYGCRYRVNIPEYRLNFEHAGHVYSAVSASNCQNGSPWNVIVDGKSYVQLSGAIGVSLEALLQTSGVELKVGDSAGMITFSEPIELEGYSSSGDEKAVSWFDSQFRKDTTFGSWLGEAETKFGWIGNPEVACNQASSVDCKDVSARYKLRLKGGSYEYPVTLKYTSGRVETKAAPSTALTSLKQLMDMPEMTYWPEALERKEVLRLTWTEPSECKMVRGLSKHFGKSEPVSCGMWTITSKDYPTAIYYVGLESIWLEPGHDYKGFFDRVSKHRKSGGKKYARHDYKGFGTPDKDTNLFLRSDGKPIAFVTKKGKTTIKE